MTEVEIRFDRENLEGIVAVGTYLSDAARRLGIRFKSDCITVAGEHCCAVSVVSGDQLLSTRTAIETAYLQENRRGSNWRLACQARIERAGELVIMTGETKTHETEEQNVDDKNEKYKKEFADMPLEKKIASLVQLEALALGETFSFIINSPFKVFDKAMDVMAEFGFKKEENARRAARPGEHAENAPTSGAQAEKKGPGRHRARKQKHPEQE